MLEYVTFHLVIGSLVLALITAFEGDARFKHQINAIKWDEYIRGKVEGDSAVNAELLVDYESNRMRSFTILFWPFALIAFSARALAKMVIFVVNGIKAMLT